MKVRGAAGGWRAGSLGIHNKYNKHFLAQHSCDKDLENIPKEFAFFYSSPSGSTRLDRPTPM